MKKVLLILALVLLTSPLGWAETCTADTLTPYISKASSCVPQRATFRDFSYSRAVSFTRASTQALGRSGEKGVREFSTATPEVSSVDAPEPTSMLLLGSGLLGLAGFIRFRHRSKR